MKQETAEKLIKFYSHEAQILLSQHSLFVELTELSDRYHALESPSIGKAMRWLGFAQGASVALGFFTLEQVKEHSRLAVHEEKLDEHGITDEDIAETMPPQPD